MSGQMHKVKNYKNVIYMALEPYCIVCYCNLRIRTLQALCLTLFSDLSAATTVEEVAIKPNSEKQKVFAIM